MSDCSPKWTRPADVMKIRRLKKRKSLKESNAPSTDKNQITQNDNHIKICSSGGKRLNPFSRSVSPNKKRKIIVEDCEDIGIGVSSGADENRIDILKDSSLTPSAWEHQPESQLRDYQEEEPKKTLKDKDVTQNTTKKGGTVPVDWSLKQKLRVVSSKPLSWCVSLKSAEEAKGLCDFVKGSEQAEDVKEEERGCSFQSCCGYWMHPNVPWLNLFPRIVSDHKIGKSNSFTMNEDVHSAFYSDWADSFTSVFYLLRCQRCPFFYMCTHQFSVLFRMAGFGGIDTLNAVITPTTRGFRQALKDDGIEFSMPVLEHRTKRKYTEGLIDSYESELSQNLDSIIPATEKTEVNGDVEEEDEDLAETDEGASTWLEEMGLNKKEFPSLDPNKVKMNRDGFRVIDNRPESLLLVEGTNVQALFNFLLNSKSCIASTGVQAGIPPTILCPVAFKGATQKMLKAKHSITNQVDQHGHKSKSYVLEITGPIQPHNIMKFCQLFKDCLCGDDFSLVCNSHEPTHPFNYFTNSVSSSTDANQFVNSCLSEHILSNFLQCSEDGDTQPVTLKELHYRSGMYHWN